MKAEIDSQKSDGPWKGFEFKGLVCDPEKLQQTSWERQGELPPGVQGELLAAYRADDNTADGFYMLSGLIIFIGILPAVWYFLLARLGEIATAVRRK